MSNLFRKFFKREEHLTVKVLTDLSKVSDEELAKAVERLSERSDWKFFEEQIRRLREFHLRELVLATDEKSADRLRGRIKGLDLMLQIKQ
jgi:hypothetical protein